MHRLLAQSFIEELKELILFRNIYLRFVLVAIFSPRPGSEMHVLPRQKLLGKLNEGGITSSLALKCVNDCLVFRPG